ncbi:hypothetical protein [Catellatospora chokoriensis]|uniref:Uncharacterized protein n=1 Tax=Catellatospora chokoriensis TaxID=310353 RepID=A0A8J3NXZ3_9ACTN|nr:hypothetical protein [Catellatospora chokoriensis]GIF94790.1 hypothetical protein Cch02nite_82340 [Catellatospora chokoriensis]
MRGNHAVIGLLGDTFAFTFIQEYVAIQLGVAMGTYGHHVGSMHINVLDEPKVDKILAAGSTTRFEPARMPSTTTADLQVVATWEELLSTDRDRYTPGRTPDLHEYRRQVIALLLGPSYTDQQLLAAAASGTDSVARPAAVQGALF